MEYRLRCERCQKLYMTKDNSLPWNCGCDPAILALKQQANSPEELSTEPDDLDEDDIIEDDLDELPDEPEEEDPEPSEPAPLESLDEATEEPDKSVASTFEPSFGFDE